MSAGAESRALPLEGLLVVSVEQAVAAPFAARQLADLGARVIKVERPGEGDFARHYDDSVRGLSSYFAWLNRGKESVTADLKDPADRELVEQLAGRADVFLQNLAPGAAQRLGLAAEQLVERHPRLVACDISGYGRGGPDEHRKAYDLLIQCEAGLVSVTGSAEAPAKVGISVADIAAAMYAFAGILAALYEREHTGRGAVVEVSLLDALSEWMGQPFYFGRYGGADPPRTGAAHATIAPYGPFATGDGIEIDIGVQNDRDWSALCGDVLGREDLRDDPRFASNAQRVAHRATLDALLAEAFRGFDAQALSERLDAAGVAFGVMRGAAALAGHPQLLARGRWRSVGSPVGEIAALLPPLELSGREGAMGAIPALGQHDEAVRAWLAGGDERRRSA